MRVAIGCDHIVTDIKDQLKKYLENKGFEVFDCGTYDFVRTHYPIYGKRVAEKVINLEADCGIVLCGTGVGISNAANKIKGIRCALVGDVVSARVAKEEFNCNVLAVGGRVSGMGMIEDILDTYFECEYLGKNDEMIQRMDVLGHEIERGDEFFDEFLKKWELGEYHD